jgi:hypothetical protein
MSPMFSGDGPESRMPRILVSGSWYDPVSGASLYECDYENEIVRQSETLFPGYFCIQFKSLIESEFGSNKPDLALIDHLYRAWYVVEVELDVHPLRSHVEEQVRTFAYGQYHQGHIDDLCRTDPRLDRARVKSMFLGDQPSVLVLVTRDKPAWSTALAQYGASVGVIEIFRDDLDRAILRVDGDQPVSRDIEVLSECVMEQAFPKALKVLSPAPFSDLEDIDLHLDGQVSKWGIVRVADAAWLIPLGKLPMKSAPGARWVIRRVGAAFEINEGDRNS